MPNAAVSFSMLFSHNYCQIINKLYGFFLIIDPCLSFSYLPKTNDHIPGTHYTSNRIKLFVSKTILQINTIKTYILGFSVEITKKLEENVKKIVVFKKKTFKIEINLLQN